MVEEMETLDKNEGWDLVDLLATRNPIGKKMIFKKLNVEGKVEKYEACLVAKCFS